MTSQAPYGNVRGFFSCPWPAHDDATHDRKKLVLYDIQRAFEMGQSFLGRTLPTLWSEYFTLGQGLS